MKRPCRSSAAQRAVEPRLARPRTRQHMTSAATQFAARIATSIVHAQFGPCSTGLRAIHERKLRADLVEVARVAGQPVRGRQQRQVLEARELPRNLDVRAVAEHDRDLRDVHRRPAAARLEVGVPVDLGSEVDRAGAEQVEAVAADRRRRARAARPARHLRDPEAGPRDRRRSAAPGERVRAARRPRWRRRARGAAGGRSHAAVRSAACARRAGTRTTAHAGAGRGARARHWSQPPPRREAFAQSLRHTSARPATQ